MGHGNANMVGGNWKSFFLFFLDMIFVHCVSDMVYEDVGIPLCGEYGVQTSAPHTHTPKVPVYICLTLPKHFGFFIYTSFPIPKNSNQRTYLTSIVLCSAADKIPS